jgi:hypothetical protein
MGSSFQISAASFQSPPTFSHTPHTCRRLPCGVGPLVFRLKVPISRAESNFRYTGGTTVQRHDREAAYPRARSLADHKRRACIRISGRFADVASKNQRR